NGTMAVRMLDPRDYPHELWYTVNTLNSPVAQRLAMLLSSNGQLISFVDGAIPTLYVDDFVEMTSFGKLDFRAAKRGFPIPFGEYRVKIDKVTNVETLFETKTNTISV